MIATTTRKRRSKAAREEVKSEQQLAPQRQATAQRADTIQQVIAATWKLSADERAALWEQVCAGKRLPLLPSAQCTGIARAVIAMDAPPEIIARQLAEQPTRRTLRRRNGRSSRNNRWVIAGALLTQGATIEQLAASLETNGSKHPMRDAKRLVSMARYVPSVTCVDGVWSVK